MAKLGDLALEGGEVIRDCRIAYRTFGRLDASRSNAVLVIPWFLGTSHALARQIGPGKLVDSSRYYVIAVDPLGNGVSSSPSNSAQQPGEAFPRIAMHDLVESQYQLLTRELGLTHVKAVVGISMGGMQTFEWMVRHPEIMDKAVAIVGTPRFPPEDAADWRASAAALRTVPAWRRAARALGRADLRGALAALTIDPIDHARQSEALLTTDVTAPYGGSMERAAARVRARALVVVSPTDTVVKPEAALELARLVGAEVLELDGRCGHQAPSCDRRKLWPAVARLLDE